MFTLTGFADEISSDLDKQIEVLNEEGIGSIELRGVWEKNVLDLTDEEIAEIKETLDQEGIGISAIGSPIGKVKITDDFEEHLERFERALYLADYFAADYIRLFSYYIPEGDDPADWRDEVMYRMKKKTEMAAEAGVVLLHENEREIYGDTGKRCRDILTTVDSPYLRAIFDPANFVVLGLNSYPDELLQVVEFIEYLHIKDAIYQDGEYEIKPAGEGDGEVGKTLDILKDRGFTGFLSLEPHLTSAGKMEGFSGPEAFRVASSALKKIIDDIGGTYS